MNTPKSQSRSSSPPSWKQRLIRWSLALIAIGLIGVLIVFFMIRSTPGFYRSRLDTSALVIKEGEDFETHFLDLRNDVRREGNWSAHFTEDEINHWLGNDLKDKFSSSLPAWLQEPRVELSQDEIRFGVRIQNGFFSGVASLDVLVGEMERANTVPLTFKSIRLGTFSIPVGWCEMAISSSLRSQNVYGTWVDSDQGRTFLMTLPTVATVDAPVAHRMETNKIDVDVKEMFVEGKTTIGN
ncbi:MAG: hypothetical protein R3C03_02230 [Pirellulaceae bacterium]